MMHGGSGNNNVLKRNPTTTELDEFINRAMQKRDMNPQMLYLDLQNKLEPQRGVSMLSFEEAEIYPMVMNRLVERFSK
ncbi:hypothetical protein [Vibrio phage JSF13]|nr:hypothetical protein [Vibrio phage JSF5]ASV41782.1 hypothetical protein [Vibrio phage JSF1]ASV42146.1 hypothetical protein [Vibrio phage JSF13]ASV42502.1 hypothetical protein [Vibrio phage JSF14]ASV42672.1 hypothetical protein [Vibrio phage JSF17]